MEKAQLKDALLFLRGRWERVLTSLRKRESEFGEYNIEEPTEVRQLEYAEIQKLIDTYKEMLDKLEDEINDLI
jgi:hypothetical protein